MISGIQASQSRLRTALICLFLPFAACASRADGCNPASALTAGKSALYYGTTQFGGTADKGTVYQVSSTGKVAILYSFSGASDGAAPRAGLYFNTDGNLYGSTSAGASGSGTLFQITAKGVLTTLHTFTVTSGIAPILKNSDGAFPIGDLVKGADGALYGTTPSGGSNGVGTIFRVTTTGSFSTLYTFSALDTHNHNTDGSHPQAGLLTSGSAFYGVTSAGGTTGFGTVFKVNETGKFTALYTFTNGTDGAAPVASLVAGPSSLLFGVTPSGGSAGKGVLFQVTTKGVLTGLHSFAGTDGANPMARLLYGKDKNLYGVTVNGGAYGRGTIFQATPVGAVTTVHAFGTLAGDGAAPEGGLTQDGDGFLHATTFYGGYGVGVIYRSTTAGNLTIQYRFTSPADGRSPEAPLLLAKDGNFYGTAYSGGANDEGAVFKMTPAGVFTTLYDFSGINASDANPDGARPYAGLVQGTDGNLYGTTQYGGTDGYGTIFVIPTAGFPTTLYSFTGPDGARPVAGLVSDGAGNLYGVTHDGGTNDKGVIFKITQAGSFSVLYSFSETIGGANNDGSHPAAPLFLASNGALYGTTILGGTSGNGAIFSITTGGTFTNLHSFTGAGTEGTNPESSLIPDSTPTDGYLYGTTYSDSVNFGGTFFKVSTTGTTIGKVKTLFSFGATTNDAANPEAGLVLGTDGKFYGTAQSGGDTDSGAVFRIDTTGHEAVIYSFQGDATDGAEPASALILDAQGNFYGTCTAAGANNAGSIYKVTSAGVFTLLHSFLQ